MIDGIALFNLLLFSVAFYALVRGGAPERIVAILFVAAAGATRAVAVSLVTPFVGVEWGFMAIDVTLLLALIAVALRADRFWPMNVAALQLLSVGIHLAKLLMPELYPWVYAVTLGFLGYPMVAFLGLGTYRHRRRLLQNGVDRSWSRSSHLWPGTGQQISRDGS